VTVPDLELQRLLEARGVAWARLVEASGCAWQGARLVPAGATVDEDATLASMAAARVGTERVREIIAAIDHAEAEIGRHARALRERDDRLRQSRVA
jgi:hypothetical protein